MLRSIQCFKSHFLKSELAVKIYSDNVCKYSSQSNKLLDYLQAKIQATGPITVADYMKQALVSPTSGYYMSRDVFGSKGDFITSPEISQVFGELIGVWFFNEWSKVGRPQPLQLVELGPGRGTLTDDILRVFSKLSYEINLSVHFVEISPYLCQLQMSKLCSQTVTGDLFEKTLTTKHGYPLTWYPHLNAVPADAFTLFLAHEFFDAIPIHKFQKTPEGWREILIDCKDGELKYVISRGPTPASQLLIDKENEKRDHVEISPESWVLLDNLLKRMKEDGGISLLIDYGHFGTKTDTFRGFKGHELHDPLKSPGDADLTADVDFEYLSRHAKEKAVVVGPVTQAVFLKKMGIDLRLERLMKSASPEERKLLKSSYEMLTNPDQMGERFKFMGLFPLVIEKFLCKYPPAGF